MNVGIVGKSKEDEVKKINKTMKEIKDLKSATNQEEKR